MGILNKAYVNSKKSRFSVFREPLSEVCNLVSALSDTQDSLSRVSESAENWLASQLPPMTDDQSQFFLSGHG